MTDDTSRPIVPYKPAEGFIAPVGEHVVQLRDVLEEMGFTSNVIKAEDLIDTHFAIYAAKPFQSSFDDQSHAYYCRCFFPETGEIFATTLGGGAVVEILDAYVQSEPTAPLGVVLREKEGGRFGRYYTLE